MRTTTAAFVFASLTAFSGACSKGGQTPATPSSSQAATSVPPGTEFAVKLNDPISTRTSTPGEFFTSTVVTPIRAVNGNLVVHEGALVRGRVVGIDEPAGSVRISFQSIDTDKGPIPISVTVKKPRAQANYRVEEVYNPQLPYNAILLPPGGSTAVGGGPAQPPQGGGAQKTQVQLPTGTQLQLVITQPLAMPKK